VSIYVVGVAAHPATVVEKRYRLEEMVFRVSRAALENAGVSRGQVDHVTLGACDELDGRPISSMLMAAPAGGFMTDEMKVTDSGLMALCLGMARLMTGEFGLGLVSSWCKSSKTDIDPVMRLRGEPFLSRPIGIDGTVADGLFSQAVGMEFGIEEEEASRRAAAALRRAASNERALGHSALEAAAIQASPYVATPLRDLQRAPASDGAATMVLASERFLRNNPHVKPLARLTGVGWSIDSYQMGASRLRSLASFRDAWGRALTMANISLEMLDVIELESPTGWHEAAAVRALGIDDDRISPSGGTFAQNPLVCTGLIGAVEAVLQVSGQAGAVQRAGARRAAAHSCHGFAQQGNVVACFESVGGQTA